jgi:hypothetical protein
MLQNRIDHAFRHAVRVLVPTGVFAIPWTIMVLFAAPWLSSRGYDPGTTTVIGLTASMVAGFAALIALYRRNPPHWD